MIEVDELVQLRETFERLAGDDVGLLPGAQREVVVREARRLRELGDAVEVMLLGSLEREGYCDSVHGTTTAAWFARETGLPHGTVRAQLKTARLLGAELAPTAAAWLGGRITREHVRVLCDAANPRIRDRFAAEQEVFLGSVAGKRFDVWRGEVTERAGELDQDGLEPDDPTRTTASWGRSDAFAQLQARFGGADAEVVEQIIEARTDELFRQQARDRKVFPEMVKLTRNELRGHAIVALLIESQAVDPRTTSAPTTAVHLVLRVGGLPDLHADPDGDGDVGWPAWSDLRRAVTWRLTNPDHRRLHPDAFAAMLCGCDVHPLLVDADGNPLKLGRTARLAPTPLRRAVLIRDGGCVFPGCDCPVSWADIHHLITWEDGGPTDLDNLAALCRRHHGVAHRNGWSLTATGDGWFIWQSPSGARHWSQRHGTQRAGPLPNAPPRTAAA